LKIARPIVFCCILLITLVPTSGLHAVHAATTAAAQRYYLALGDSLAAGYQTSSTPIDRYCTNAKLDREGQRGYVCVVWRSLRAAYYHDLKLHNLGLASLPGEDTCSFRSLTACSGQKHRYDVARKDVPPYNIHTQAQLSVAVRFLKSHRGHVPVISLDIGGDDFVPLAQAAANGNIKKIEAQLAATEARLKTNYGEIVAALRAAAPASHLILVDQYNPASGVPASLFPAKTRKLLKDVTAAVKGIRAIVQSTAKSNHAIYADVYTPFLGRAPYLTYITYYNVHPNSAGYKVYAGAVYSSFKRAVKR
jgi:lysophospholipase L1-like esterase